MTARILIMGLPGAGKTTLASALKQYLEEYDISVDWFNADTIRKQFNDWDFTRDGRIRQSLRMLELAKNSTNDVVICDFVAPLPEMRENFSPDILIWMDTISSSSYADTNSVFVPPDAFDFKISEQYAEKWAAIVGIHILDRLLKLN